jgi:hypothetical protein
MNYNSCENCRYFKTFISDGFCLRFPQEVKKGFQDWCGEFKTSGKWEYENYVEILIYHEKCSKNIVSTDPRLGVISVQNPCKMRSYKAPRARQSSHPIL